MSLTVFVPEFGRLERGLLNLETMRESGLLVTNVPVIAGKILVNDFFRVPDQHINLALIAQEKGELEVMVDDNRPFQIEYFAEGAPRHAINVLTEPVHSLGFVTADFHNNFLVKQESLVRSTDGLQRFTRLVARGALAKQKRARVAVHHFAESGRAKEWASI